MNTSALKSFAPSVRNQLLEAVERKLDYTLTSDTPDLREKGTQMASLRWQEKADREGLIERAAYTWFNRLAALRFLDARHWHPFRSRVLTPASEEETQPELLKQFRNGSLPGEFAPYVDADRLRDLLDGRLPTAIAGADPQGEVYRHLILAACRYYHALMPFMFEEIDDETELLLPDDLLTQASPVEGFRTEILDKDCEEVEVLGWLYQFYISEKKDAVMARKKAVPSEDIPAVTQLFTPHWIVRYLVENSLGRLWLRSRPNSKLKEHMPYYVEDPEGQTPADSLTVATPEEIKLLDPACGSAHMLTYAFDLLVKIYEEEGHAPSEIPEKILTHNLHGLEICPRAAQLAQFALVCKAREQSRTTFRRPVQPQVMCLKNVVIEEEELEAWSETTDFGSSVREFTSKWSEDGTFLKHLTALNYEEVADALLMELVKLGTLEEEIGALTWTKKLKEKAIKAYQKEPKLEAFSHSSRRDLGRVIFRRKLHEAEMSEFIGVILPLGEQLIHSQIHQFREHTETFGALIQPVLDGEQLAALVAKIGEQAPAGDLLVQNTHRKLRRVLDQAEMLNQRYQVVVANPPYMGSGNFNPALRAWLKPKYKVTRTDLYAIFLERNFMFVENSGLLGMVTMQGWMFTRSYEELRGRLVREKRITSFVQLGTRAFDSISGEIVQTCAFVMANAAPGEAASHFIRLVDGVSTSKESALLAGENMFSFKQLDFGRIPGEVMVYWAGEKILNIFDNLPSAGALAAFREGIHTGNNDQFLRLWTEVAKSKFEIAASNANELDQSGCKWVPYNKGGKALRWFGGNEWIIAFDRQSRDSMSELTGHVRPSQSLYFKEGGTWPDVSSGIFGVRFYPDGYLFDAKGPVGVGSNIRSTIAGLNSSPFIYLASLLMPTLSFKCGTVKTIPLPDPKGDDRIAQTADSAINLARADWDNSETSWDFRDLPLLRTGDWEVDAGQPGGPWKGRTLAESWDHYAAYCTAAIRRMQELETENNRLWIDAYGLQDELTPEVPENEITLARADAKKDMAAFLSYAVGCMMGRYSLDAPGLILANAGDTVEDYVKIIAEKKQADGEHSPFTIQHSQFVPDADAIIPVLDGEWFEDDIVARTREFLRVSFGEDTLNENLRFIEDSLGKPLRKYFLTDFYKDHLKTYKKRPIYWLFQSPKKGFNALIYLHRYTPDSLNILLNDYLRDYLKKVETRLQHLEHTQATTTITREKTAARREADKLRKTQKECQDWERDTLLPLAQQRITIDLDDGVKANYPKFTGAVAKVAGL